MLRSPNGYDFAGLKAHLEEKDNNRYRVICVPTVRDRVVQRAILDFLATKKLYRFESNSSYGFLTEKTVPKAIGRAASLRNGNGWAYKTDISAFFDSIDRMTLEAVIRKKIRVPSIQDLLLRATRCEIKPRNLRQRKKIRKAGVIDGVGLRQGMPISPYLSNLFLFEFDKHMEASGFQMVRYADDLIFFANSEKQCHAIHSRAEELLATIGLSISPIGQGKTKVVAPSEPVEFLGVELGIIGSVYQPLVPEKRRTDMRAELYTLADLNELDRNKITISKLMQRLDGKVSGWNASYKFCANAAQLGDMLEDSKKEVIRRLFVNELGIELTAKNRRFLGIG